MGWGFDVRNLSVLLRVNFRNVNPHTLEVVGADDVMWEPLWCNAIDLGSLVHHPEMDPKVNQIIAHRARLLNLLSDRTKTMLATSARELYSFDYQGFYDWVANQPQFDVLMRAMGYRVTQRGTLHDIETIQRKRRKATIAGIQNSTTAQSGEHFCEPAGIHRESDLYHVLEHYKAGVARDLVTYLEQLAQRRRSFCMRLEDEMLDYRATRFSAITKRYAREAVRAMINFTQKGRAMRLITRPRIVLWKMVFASQREDISIEDTSIEDTSIEVSLVGDKYEVRINAMAVDAETPEDVFPLLESILPQIIHPGKRIRLASITGGIVSLLPKTSRWKKTVRSDNRFLAAAAREWILGVSYVSWMDSIIIEEGGPLWTSIPHVRIRQLQARMPKEFCEHMYMSVARNMSLHAPDIFEFELINQRQLKAGYDGFEGSLIDKLRAALDYRTCVQDVGGDMCEMLSVPYPPEDAKTFASFQCDHTNVPPLICPRVPLNMMPITNLRLPQNIFGRMRLSEVPDSVPRRSIPSTRSTRPLPSTPSTRPLPSTRSTQPLPSTPTSAPYRPRRTLPLVPFPSPPTTLTPERPPPPPPPSTPRRRRMLPPIPTQPSRLSLYEENSDIFLV